MITSFLRSVFYDVYCYDQNLNQRNIVPLGFLRINNKYCINWHSSFHKKINIFNQKLTKITKLQLQIDKDNNNQSTLHSPVMPLGIFIPTYTKNIVHWGEQQTHVTNAFLMEFKMSTVLNYNYGATVLYYEFFYTILVKRTHFNSQFWQ